MRRLIGLICAVMAASVLAAPTSAQTAKNTAATDAFIEALDLRPLSVIAVHYEGRLTSFDSFAYKVMKRVTGAGGYLDRPHAFTLLDKTLRPEAYEGTDSVFVRKKLLRERIASTLLGRPDVSEERVERFVETGLISRELLSGDAEVVLLISRLKADAIRTGKHVAELETALALSDPQILIEQIRIIPPPTNALDRRWHHMLELFAHASGPDGEPLAAGTIVDLPEPTAERIRHAWATLANSWRLHATPGEDPVAHAETVSAAMAELAVALEEAAPEIYPSRAKMGWESWYFQWGHMTWVWMIYMLAIAALLMALVYKWPAARGLGLGIFLGATALHTAAVGLRWYVSGHWPNSNMFEAVTTAAWMGSVGAIFLELVARKTAMKNLFALAASVSGAVALMCAHFLPVSLTPAISNRMPILHDVWLYIHTNVIIFSYMLIAMAAATSIGYLLLRLLGAKADYARGGGAGTLIGMGAASMSELSPRKPSAPAVLDGATMILLELAFVLLWAGTIMGAIWADHSWGRPWGWDPKEVFALVSFLVFVILVHVRLKTRDKGLWTAWLALFGCGVMVFNWIVINFIISGLHSYA